MGLRGRYDFNAESAFSIQGAIQTPRLNRVGVVNHIEDFSATSFGSGNFWWSNVGSPVLSSDTTNYQCTDGTTLAGTKMQTVASGTEAKMFKVLPVASLDVDNCHLVVDMFVHEGSGGSAWTNITHINVNLKDGASTNIAYKVATNTGFNGGFVPGWLKFAIPLVSGKGALDLTDIDQIEIVINKTEGTTPAVTFGRLMFYAQPTTPGIVVFGFDGSYTAQKRAAMYMNSKGITGTFFTDYDRIGLAGKMTLDDLYQLKKANHMIANYPNSGAAFWLNQTLAERKDVMADSGFNLAQLGFGQGARHVSTPGSGCDQDDYNVMMGGFLDVLTGHSNGGLLPLTFYDLQHLPFVASIDDAGTEHEDAMTDAAADHGIAMFIFHQTDGQSSDITYAHFKDIVDAAKVLIDAGTLVSRNLDDIIYGNWD